MRRYETVVIAHPSLSEEERQPLFDKIKGLIPEPQGLLIKFDKWGQKRLAYEIRKQTRGFYVLVEYCGDGALVKELERNLRLDDRALKFMTVCIDQDSVIAKVQAEIEAAKKEAAEQEVARAAEIPPEVMTSVEEDQGPPEGTDEKASLDSNEPEEPETKEQPMEKEEPNNGIV